MATAPTKNLRPTHAVTDVSKPTEHARLTRPVPKKPRIAGLCCLRKHVLRVD